MGLVAPRHVGSSQTRARTRVPCIGRWILNHCATREALNFHSDTFRKMIQNVTLMQQSQDKTGTQVLLKPLASPCHSPCQRSLPNLSHRSALEQAVAYISNICLTKKQNIIKQNTSRVTNCSVERLRCHLQNGTHHSPGVQAERAGTDLLTWKTLAMSVLTLTTTWKRSLQWATWKRHKSISFLVKSHSCSICV